MGKEVVHVRATAHPLARAPSPGSRCEVECADKPRFWQMQGRGFVVRCVRMYRSRTYRACCNITSTARESHAEQPRRGQHGCLYARALSTVSVNTPIHGLKHQFVVPWG